jgi:hypothetical protein
MDCVPLLSLVMTAGENNCTYTLGYNLSVSVTDQHRWTLGCQERLTVQNRSKVFHSLQIFGTNFSSGSESVQNLLSETSENIWVFGKHRHRKRSQSCSLSRCV